ncbi:MAG: hypothetical protein ACP5NV_03605 [Candidatus Woesearchaeota archaeon]
MKNDGFKLDFEHSDLKYFTGFSKYNSLSGIVLNNMDLITPSELSSVQMDNEFPEKNDLQHLRNAESYVKILFIDKRALVYRENDFSNNASPSNYEPDIIIISSNQIKTKDFIKANEKKYAEEGCFDGYDTLSIDKFEELKKNALKMPKNIYNSFLNKESSLDNSLKHEFNNWIQKFLDFIFEGNSVLLQEYLNYNEQITKKAFYDSMRFKLYGNNWLNQSIFEKESFHLLRITSAHVDDYSLDITGYKKIVFPTFEFDDTSVLAPKRFVGTTSEFQKRYSD